MTLCVVLLAAAPAAAESLDPAEVAADAKWLLHVNVDDIRYTTLAQDIQQQLIQGQDNQGRLDWVQDKLGINLRTDLHGLTLYGRDYAPQAGVGVVHAEYDRKKIVAVVEKQPKHKASDYRDYTIHEWQAERGDQHQKVALAFHGKGTIVLSGSSEQAQSALDVLDGRQPSLKKKSQSPLLEKVPNGTFFRGSAIGLEDVKPQKQAVPFAGQVKQFALSVSEQGPNLELQATAVASSDQVAQQLAQAGQKFAQASSGPNAGNSKFGKLLKQVNVKRDGDQVSLDIKIDRETFLDLLKQTTSSTNKNAPKPPGKLAPNPKVQ